MTTLDKFQPFWTSFDQFKHLCIYLSKESTVHDQYSIVDAMAQWQPIVNFSENVDHIGGVFSFDLTFEAVHFVHVLTLVVTSVYEKVIWIK